MKQGGNKGIEVFEVQPHELMFGLVDVIRETEKKIGYYEMKSMTKDHLDDVFEETIRKETFKKSKKILTTAEVHVLAAKLYTKIMLRGSIQGLSVLSAYYAEAKKISRQELLNEKHKSKRLSRHIKATGQIKPCNVAAHAIVSGTHSEAVAARKILARWKIRIDDPDNGVFLPRDYRFIPHQELPNAVNHAELHTDEYYVNVTNTLGVATSAQECRLALRLIAKELKDGTLEY